MCYEKIKIKEKKEKALKPKELKPIILPPAPQNYLLWVASDKPVQKSQSQKDWKN